jgi:hypothetical protein
MVIEVLGFLLQSLIQNALAISVYICHFIDVCCANFYFDVLSTLVTRRSEGAVTNSLKPVQ